MKERKVFHDIKLSVWPVYEYSQQIPAQKNVGFIATGIETWAHSKLCCVTLQSKAAGNNTFIRKIQEPGPYWSIPLSDTMLYFTISFKLL